MNSFLKNSIPSFALAALIACGLLYATDPLGVATGEELRGVPMVVDAGAASDAPVLREGPPGSEPVIQPEPPPMPLPADPIATPTETVSVVVYYWRLGGWPVTLCLLGLVCAAASLHFRPKDENGDGLPDPKGWRGYVWIGATAMLLPLVPLLDRAAGVLGASWASVGTAAAAAVTLAWGYVWGMRSGKAR